MASSLPFVSILVAARNEEHHIQKCLEALLNLDYPSYEIWVGDDASTDSTASIVCTFVSRYPQVHLLSIERSSHLRGKANVLAQLAHQAKGEFFFITDADTEVPSSWINTHFLYHRGGINTAATAIKAHIYLHHFQHYEWICAFGVLHLLSQMGFPLTAVGNNMMFPAHLYHEIGGYEQIPFSIIEDYALFDAFRQQGYTNTISFDVCALAYTAPAATIEEIAMQRRRWLAGIWASKDLKGRLALLFCLMLFVCFPFLVAFVGWEKMLLLWVIKNIGQCAWAWYFFRKAKLNFRIAIAICMDFYFVCVVLVVIRNYIKERNIVWKERKYV